MLQWFCATYPLGKRHVYVKLPWYSSCPLLLVRRPLTCFCSSMTWGGEATNYNLINSIQKEVSLLLTSIVSNLVLFLHSLSRHRQVHVPFSSFLGNVRIHLCVLLTPCLNSGVRWKTSYNLINSNPVYPQQNDRQHLHNQFSDQGRASASRLQRGEVGPCCNSLISCS